MYQKSDYKFVKGRKFQVSEFVKNVKLDRQLKKRAVMLIIAVFCLAFVLLMIHFKSTGAWLYDSDQINVDYSIVEL